MLDVLRDWQPTASTAVAAFVVLVVAGAARIVLRRAGRGAVADDMGALRWPARALALFVTVAVAGRRLPDAGARAVFVGLCVVAAVWLVVRLLWFCEQVVFRRLRIDNADNLRARSRRTKVQLVRRVASLVVVVGAAIGCLVGLTPLASFGPTIVAYAGLIGVVLGFAMRAPIENLAAGMVVAFSEPIRIDDVVVVEGEWGRIEEIGLVHVVVRIWDDRRLVLPTSRFVNEPFENWTRRSSDLIGSLTLWLDYGADLDELRDDVDQIVRDNRRWDGRFTVVQVVELGQHAMQVRVLVTAGDAQNLWDLRCELREALLSHLAVEPHRIPVLRTRAVS